MEIECLSGKANVEPGTKFTADGVEWEVARIDEGGTVLCKPNCAPSVCWKTWERGDGTFPWCGDSVVANLLEAVDGNCRSARGHLLTH